MTQWLEQGTHNFEIDLNWTVRALEDEDLQSVWESL